MRAHYRLPGLAAAVLGAWLIGSCAESPMDIPIPNRSPEVAISAGPIRDSVGVFIVTFNWNASDGDGQVVRFIYAIDDTSSADAWIETTSYELTLLLTAPDSAGVDSIRVGLGEAVLLRYRFRGAHTFFLKAIDDDGAESAPAALSFTSETFAPETEILNPDPSRVIELGAQFTVTWKGTDIDGTEDPVGYSYRIVPVMNVVNLTGAEIESTLFDPASPGRPWSAFEPRLSAPIDVTGQLQDYIFGVVALDQAGAVEPRLRSTGQPGPTNTLRIRARETGGLPGLCVSSSVKTVCCPTADERLTTFQIPANSNITFTWEGDASPYGGTIAGYSYGIDLLEPQRLDDPGWAPESAALTRVVLRFDLPEGSRGEEHLFFVRTRDNVGTVVICELTLVVVPLSGERDVLLVDDFSGDQRGRAPADCVPPPPPDLINPSSDWPQDQCHDQLLREALEDALASLGHEDWVVDRYEPLDPMTGHVILGGVEIDSTSFDYWVFTGPVNLINLARYKLVVWNVRSEDSTMLRLMNQEGQDNFLAVYIEAGGNVWITGTGSFSRTLPQGRILSPHFWFEPRDFVFRFLKIESVVEGVECRNGCFRNSGLNLPDQRLHGFELGYASAMARREGYPDTLRVARPPFDDRAKGVPNCEAMVPPLGLDINPRLRLFGGQLDTLYFYLSNGRVQAVPPRNSFMDHGASALRYSGPGQGRLMMWGFPLYFFPVSDVEAAMVASIRWLLRLP